MPPFDAARSGVTHPAVRAWLLEAQRTSARGPVVVRRADASTAWVLSLARSQHHEQHHEQHRSDPPPLTLRSEGPFTPPAASDLTGLLTEAVGFQLSHRLRSPLSQLAGHHALAKRALDLDDPTGARDELEDAAAMLERLLNDAQEIAETVSDLLRAVASRGIVAADVDPPTARNLLMGVRAATPPPAEREPDARLRLDDRGSGIALIHIPDAEPSRAAAVAQLLASMSRALDVAEVQVLVGGAEVALLGRFPSVAHTGPPPRCLADDDLARQAFVLGRALAATTHGGIVPVAAALGALLTAGGRVLHACGGDEESQATATTLAAVCTEQVLLDLSPAGPG